MTGEPAGERGPEREIEDLLRRAARERPDALFREQARRAFLAGQAESEPPSRAPAPARMGLAMETPADRAFAAWLAARSPSAPAREEFRRAARALFLSAAATAQPARRRARPAVQFLVLSLAAAAILAVTFLLPEPERWRVRLEGPLRLAETDYGPGDDERVAVELEGAGTVETLSSPVRFSLAGVLEVELLAGAELAFPPLPELDGASTVAFELTRGEAYLRTAEGYPGNPIVIHTPAADVAVHGTTLGVLVTASGTCVCVAAGVVGVSSDRLPNAHQEVGAHQTLFVFDDRARMPMACTFASDPATPEYAHTQGLIAFQDEP